MKQRAFLREQRRKARHDSEMIEEELKAIEFMKRDYWFPFEGFNSPFHVKLRIEIDSKVFYF